MALAICHPTRGEVAIPREFLSDQMWEEAPTDLHHVFEIARVGMSPKCLLSARPPIEQSKLTEPDHQRQGGGMFEGICGVRSVSAAASAPPAPLLRRPRRT